MDADLVLLAMGSWSGSQRLLEQLNVELDQRAM